MTTFVRSEALLLFYRKSMDMENNKLKVEQKMDKKSQNLSTITEIVTFMSFVN